MADYIVDWLTDAKKEAKEEGMAEGKLKGNAKGIQETLARNVNNFLKKGYSHEVIKDGLEVSEEFIRKVQII
jgi:predicted transposase YdaD